MGNLIPNEPLIYERVDEVVFARYRDKPEIPRWVVGGDADAMRRLQGDLFNWSDWQDLMNLAATNPTLRKQLSKLKDLYLIIKEDE
jgi:hypothetical protein